MLDALQATLHAFLWTLLTNVHKKKAQLRAFLVKPQLVRFVEIAGTKPLPEFTGLIQTFPLPFTKPICPFSDHEMWSVVVCSTDFCTCAKILAYSLLKHIFFTPKPGKIAIKRTIHNNTLNGKHSQTENACQTYRQQASAKRITLLPFLHATQKAPCVIWYILPKKWATCLAFLSRLHRNFTVLSRYTAL